jgi:hypothetical protein
VTSPPEPLPIEVRRLIAGPIESIEHLELLLLLARTEPRAWAADEASAEARLDPKFTERRLRDLVAAGLATEEAGRPPRFAYSPSRPSLRHDVGLLQQMYDSRPVTLVRAVYNRRTIVTQTFADAFRIKPEDT